MHRQACHAAVAQLGKAGLGAGGAGSSHGDRAGGHLPCAHCTPPVTASTLKCSVPSTSRGYKTATKIELWAFESVLLNR